MKVYIGRLTLSFTEDEDIDITVMVSDNKDKVGSELDKLIDKLKSIYHYIMSYKAEKDNDFQYKVMSNMYSYIKSNLKDCDIETEIGIFMDVIMNSNMESFDDICVINIDEFELNENKFTKFLNIRNNEIINY